MAGGNNVCDGNLLVRGTLRPDHFEPPNQTIGNAAIDPSNPILVENLEHLHSKIIKQLRGVAAVSDAGEVIHWARAPGSIIDLSAGVLVACLGNSTITIDCKKNGTSILSAPLVLNNANVAYASAPAIFSTLTYVAGDVLEVSITATVGTGTLGQGLFVNLTVRENES